MKFAIFVRDDAQSLAVSEQLKEALGAKGHQEDPRHPSLVFFVGGDGTFLRAVQHYLDQLATISFLGIRTGTLGFFCSYQKDEIERLLTDLQTGIIQKRDYRLLEGLVHFEDGSQKHIYAVNEIRIENPFRTMIADVLVDNEMLESFRGNGLLVSSTLGSSAYNKSCGGALIDPRLEAMELTEIAPLQNTMYRSIGGSLLLDQERCVTFTGAFRGEVIGYDHCLLPSDKPFSRLDILLSPQKVKLLRIEPKGFFKSIRHSFLDVMDKEED